MHVPESLRTDRIALIQVRGAMLAQQVTYRQGLGRTEPILFSDVQLIIRVVYKGIMYSRH